MASAQEVSPRTRTREDLYELIRLRGGVTRSELVDLSGLSRSTVNQAIGKLMASDRVSEVEIQPKGKGSGSGRPATLLRAVVAGDPVAGIDFGHNHVHVALADTLGVLFASAQCHLDVDLNATEAMDAATDLMNSLRAEHEIKQLSQIVAGIPGPLDRRSGLVRSPTILSSWVGLYPAQELQRRLNTAVHVENDAVLGAIGELYQGAGRGYDDFLYVKASHGIGAAMVIERRPYRGSAGLAGEIGHTHLNGHAELCRCGNRGCLEAAASVGAVRAQIAHTRPGVDPASVDLSGRQDPIAQRVLNEAGRTIGGVVANLCNLLNPSAVIVGGELGASGPSLIEGVEASIQRYAQPASVDTVEVFAAALGIRAEVTGAVQLATTLA